MPIRREEGTIADLENQSSISHLPTHEVDEEQQFSSSNQGAALRERLATSFQQTSFKNSQLSPPQAMSVIFQVSLLGFSFVYFGYSLIFLGSYITQRNGITGYHPFAYGQALHAILCFVVSIFGICAGCKNYLALSLIGLFGNTCVWLVLLWPIIAYGIIGTSPGYFWMYFIIFFFCITYPLTSLIQFIALIYKRFRKKINNDANNEDA